MTRRLQRSLLSALLLGAPIAHAEDAYLRPHEKIMWVGDSITAQGLYERYVMRVLKTLYPDAGITDVNLGIGGATAPARFAGGIPRSVDEEKPTVMTVMFGVNDTRWSPALDADKVTNYTGGLQQFADLATQKNLPMLLLRETHFSHNAAGEDFTNNMNAVLMKLFEAQSQLAEKNGLPVVDVYGAYVRELNNAWKVDPKYEFTPNVIHPTRLGHTAASGEILKAFGAGLPLGSKRGPLHLEARPAVELHAAPLATVIADEGKLAIRITAANNSGKDLHGSVVVVVADQKFTLPMDLKTGGSAEAPVEVAMASLPERWEVQPIYMAFIADGVFAANITPFYHSHLVPTDAKPYENDGKSWKTWEAQASRDSTVADVKATVTDSGMRVEFAWKDATPIAAKLGAYKSRLGSEVAGPLDMTAPFGQPCDAVELLLDLRDEKSSGRYTSNMDSIPDGCARVGLYKIEEGGKLVPRLHVSPESLASSFKLADLGGDKYAIEWTGRPPACGVGFDMLVTDTKEWKPNQQIGLYLTSVLNVGDDWLDFLRLSGKQRGIFCRVGY
jgi:lysophospholipase L1-like esterase